MDLNQLYYEYQVLRMRAERSRSPYMQRENEREAALIAATIGGLQHAAGAGAAHCWDKLSGAALVRPQLALALPHPANGNGA